MLSEDQKLYMRAYYRKHRRSMLAYQRKYYKAHRTSKLAYSRIWAILHQEERRAYQQSDRVRAYQHNYYITNKLKISKYKQQWFQARKKSRT